MRLMRASLATLVLISVGACSTSGPGGAVTGIHDPYEAQNRKVHAFNRKVDARFARSSGKGYSDVMPQAAQDHISNLADTVDLPGTVVNQVLQGELWDASRNTLRFAVNATLGFGGLADVASDLGMKRDQTDFGATLAAWGVGEGAYVELPVLGPSTTRDTAGKVVDLFTNPLSYVIPAPESYAMTGVRLLDKVGSRGRHGQTVDSVLYDSADSYAQVRLMYLQNRRFELGQSAPVENVDPMALDTQGF